VEGRADSAEERQEKAWSVEGTQNKPGSFRRQIGSCRPMAKMYSSEDAVETIISGVPRPVLHRLLLFPIHSVLSFRCSRFFCFLCAIRYSLHAFLRPARISPERRPVPGGASYSPSTEGDIYSSPSMTASTAGSRSLTAVLLRTNPDTPAAMHSSTTIRSS